MIERIDVAVTPASVQAGLRGIAVVVIDVLRATTTVVRALENGASAIIPCLEPDDAIAVRARIGRDRVLLGGERGNTRISGFDLDNSPASYGPDVVDGKTIAFTTTNGTRALQRVGHAGATAVFCGALTNRGAVVAALLASDAREALLVCAGHEGEFSLEDYICAGAIVNGVMHAAPQRVPRRSCIAPESRASPMRSPAANMPHRSSRKGSTPTSSRRHRSTPARFSPSIATANSSPRPRT
jgi:phosphosulfolactate phosphohydrolase-like enzyme